jgi:hypothetical protein
VLSAAAREIGAPVFAVLNGYDCSELTVPGTSRCGGLDTLSVFSLITPCYCESVQEHIVMPTQLRRLMKPLHVVFLGNTEKGRIEALPTGAMVEIVGESCIRGFVQVCCANVHYNMFKEDLDTQSARIDRSGISNQRTTSFFVPKSCLTPVKALQSYFQPAPAVVAILAQRGLLPRIKSASQLFRYAACKGRSAPKRGRPLLKSRKR